MSGYLLDTMVASEPRKRERANAQVMSWLAQCDASDLHLSVVTLYELHKGTLAVERRDPAQGARLRRFFKTVLHGAGRNALPITTEVALRAGDLMVPNKKSVPDVFFAATALVHGLTLVTRNVEDYADIADLEILNPWEHPRHEQER